MAGWEYRVIHINVEPPRPSGAPTSPDDPLAGPQPAGEGPNARPMFSQSFLQKEFPQFYEKPVAGPSSAPSQHPAQQLQTFLNGHGAEGWELVGVFPVGTLTMMFFRRPKAERPSPVAEASAVTGQRRVSDSGPWVSPDRLARLADATPVPSTQAAQAIGLRSAASLANHGARHGYTPGLSKRGPNGLVAIYTGSASGGKGGKERRLWIVVPAERLEG